jgi:malonate decarboxylase gamma subunit
MTLDEILKGLFPSGHDVKTSAAGLITGTGKRKNGESIAVIGVANGVALGTAGVLPLADEVLNVVAQGGNTPILVLVDTQGQLMARRDEMRGLNEYLAHLAKCLLLASHEGHRTLGLEYGKAAAGAFLATALATDRLVGLPGAQPTVMDLPSMARVTKLPLDTLKQLAQTTPIFAPGLNHLLQVGAVAETWDPNKPLDDQLEETLRNTSPADTRDELGAQRKGRTLAATVAKRVIAEALSKSDDVAST